MANRTAALYIRTKTGYKKHGKRLSDLPEGEAYQLFWYVGSRKKAKAVGRFADGAQAALIGKEAELRRAAIMGTAPEAVSAKSRSFELSVQQYLNEVEAGKSRKTHDPYSVMAHLYYLRMALTANNRPPIKAANLPPNYALRGADHRM